MYNQDTLLHTLPKIHIVKIQGIKCHIEFTYLWIFLACINVLISLVCINETYSRRLNRSGNPRADGSSRDVSEGRVMVPMTRSLAPGGGVEVRCVVSTCNRWCDTCSCWPTATISTNLIRSSKTITAVSDLQVGSQHADEHNCKGTASVKSLYLIYIGTNWVS